MIPIVRKNEELIWRRGRTRISGSNLCGPHDCPQLVPDLHMLTALSVLVAFSFVIDESKSSERLKVCY